MVWSPPSLPRVLAVLLVLTPVLSGLATVTAETQEVGCDSLPARDAAQTLSATDPHRWADVLDLDGNGQACDQEVQAVLAYLEAVVDHTAALSAGIDPLLGLVQAPATSVSTQDRLVANGIVARFAEAPAVAAGLAVPRGYAQVQEVYVTVVAAYASVADAYGAWAGTRPGTPAHAIAGQDLADRVRTATRCTHDLATLLHAHGV